MSTVAVITLAIFAIGNRVLFAAAVAALLISAGGWEKLAQSARPGMLTRSFYGIYAIKPGAVNARILVHGTTLHGFAHR